MTCGASDGHFIIVDLASDIPKADGETTAGILDIKTLAAAALGVLVVDLAPAGASKREVESIVEEAVSVYRDHREINPHGYAFRYYPPAEGAFDGVGVGVSVEPGKISAEIAQ